MVGWRSLVKGAGGENGGQHLVDGGEVVREDDGLAASEIMRCRNEGRKKRSTERTTTRPRTRRDGDRRGVRPPTLRR